MLACSVQSAETTAWLAWEQQARLPGTGALLDNGTLTHAKARAVTETFRYLTDADAIRAQAYLDLLNGVAAAARIASAEPQDDAVEAAETLAWLEARAAARTAGPATRHEQENAAGVAPDTGADGAGTGGQYDRDGDPGDEHGDDGDEPDDRGDPDDGDGPGYGGSGPQPGLPPAGRVPQRPADLVVPLTTLMGLAERPGEIQGFGLLDPGLATKLAAAAAASPRTEVCFTVTSPDGYAIGHGCARPDRSSQGNRGPGVAFPARLNLTIPATALPGLATQGRRAGPWAFTQRGTPSAADGTDPPDGYGTWTLILPSGQRFTARLDVVPAFECDHRYESHGYQPSDRLRHLVQVRDGTCTFPPCSRHARDSDFEHAQPYDKGGRTCTCNAGARSRACHRVKQSRGCHSASAGLAPMANPGRPRLRARTQTIPSLTCSRGLAPGCLAVTLRR